MNKELVIDARASEVNIALLEEKKLVELHKEKTNTSFSVGDIYLGKVKKIMPGLNAAFVDVGYEKDAFLHYLDLGPQVKSLLKYMKHAQGGKPGQASMENFELEKDIEKTSKISTVLSPNQQIIVQIAKEPISTKGPRISSEISLAGRYLVLVPFSNRISISQKIRSAEERSRLRRLINSIKPNNFGVIIRTVAENKMVADLDADLKNLFNRWKTITKVLHSARPPQKVLSELDRISTMLRDLLNESFNSVHVNDPALYEDLTGYIRKIEPEKESIVKLYKGRASIFENFGVEKHIKSSFGKIVTIKSGVYLVIEHTEAMHVIDINSGHRVNVQNDQETNALEVNLEAAVELARQLRLRDMGGIIVVDFIDMGEAVNRRKLFIKLKEEMAHDRAKHTILPPSKFGLVQITRQRVRPEMSVEIHEKCPACDGTGQIKPSIILIDEIENTIRYLVQDQNEKYLMLLTHPFVYAFLKKGLFSIRWKWFLKYRRWIRINKNNAYHIMEYHFFDSKKEEIKV